MHEQIKPPQHAVIALAISWDRYWNEVRKINEAIVFTDTATELSTLWGIGQVESVADTFGQKYGALGMVPDTYSRDNIIPGTHILFRFAPCARPEGGKLGNPGRYTIPQFTIDGIIEPESLPITITALYQKITAAPGVSNQAPPHANGGPVHQGQYPQTTQSPISIARIAPQGVF